MGHRSSIVTYHARLAASNSKRHVRSSHINGATMTRYYMGLTDPARLFAPRCCVLAVRLASRFYFLTPESDMLVSVELAR